MKHFTALFLASLVSFVVADDGKEKHGKHKKHNMTGQDRACHRMWRLTHVSETVANATRMANLQQAHPDRAQKIKDEAVKSGPELQSLQGNQTLAQYCPVLRAHENLKHDCKKLHKADKIQNRLKNNTAVQDAVKKSGKTEDEVKQRWQKELDSVQKLKSNSTLASSCAQMKSGKNSKDGSKDNKGGANPQKQKSGAATVKIAGTGAFALGMGLYVAVLLF
jgi:hypothetical protein